MHRPRREGAFSRLVPNSCVAYEITSDPANVVLFPEEEKFIVGAMPERRAEFATVRWCARQALVDLGSRPEPLVPGVRGAPNWPAGFVGSMTHCTGYRAAVAATSLDLLAIGIDAEPHLSLPEEVLELVTTSAERRHLLELSGQDPAKYWDRILFCAKEAVYKAWSSMTGRWLNFDDVGVHLTYSGVPGADGCGKFAVRALRTGSAATSGKLQAMQGRWSSSAGRAHTAVWLPGV